MFSFLKNLLAKPAQARLNPSAGRPPGGGQYEGAALGTRAAQGAHTNGGPKNGNHSVLKGVEIPLGSILAGLPLELQPRLKPGKFDDLMVKVTLEKILSQLSRGVVKISFGELRQAAPLAFTRDADKDRVLVPLPLGEILARLNPALITRRRVQKQVQVSDEISSPFESNGDGLAFSAGQRKAPGDDASEPTIAPTAPRIPSARPISPGPIRVSLKSVPTPLAPGTTPAATPAIMPSAPVLREVAATAPLRMVSAASSPAPKVVAEADPLVVGLIALAEVWPEAVRKEIVELNLVEAKVALPAQVIEQALKQGKVAFSWNTLRSWIRPAPLPAVSAHDSCVLELPLKVVAPLFLARQKQASNAKPKVSVDAEIPNLFFGFPQSDPSASAPGTSAVCKPVDTNFYVWEDSAEFVREDESAAKRGPSPGTRFVEKYATPNEITSRAAALDGVAGALIALPDGLMVASQLSSDINAETLAAFLPQIFGKVSQCTKELRMGELNNLNFTVGNIPWKIFRVNAIFFAAFGRTGQSLPTGQLAALVSELDRSHK
jgi:predicted regulator of Ras-like GTPase activity (Roadblock/LC7/MglB family)